MKSSTLKNFPMRTASSRSSAYDKSFTKVAESRNALAEEIADVIIMIEQITYAEGFENDVRRIIDEKIQRQLDRIKAVKAWLKLYWFRSD